MATIFYSMAGEGRGHATRVRAIVESLRHEHRIVLLAPEAAYDFLAPLYAQSDVEVHRVPGLLFHYYDRRLNLPRTARGAAAYLWQLPALVRDFERRLRDAGADLVLTDFEPALPRAAERAGVPVVSINHQHFLIVDDLAGIPWHLRARATATAPLVNLFCPNATELIVSSFYDPPLRPKFRDIVTQVGNLMRTEVLNAEASDAGHLLVYLRRFAHPHVLEALRRCGKEVRLYGLGEKPADGNIIYRPISDSGFLADLASCSALISNAGNQLVGEALYLRKPVLAMPEPNNFEQFINAHFLKREGGGDWVRVGQFNADRLGDFIERVPDLRAEIVDPNRYCGNERAVEAVRRVLGRIAGTIKPPVSPKAVPVAG
ncbi:glycosyltransferase family protein [Stratiformator vulcanicus]|uniref:Uncharacterized protein n=1 Tax=Stratiformator vulcanicus TaxID=2527980 RepID=A0A517R697_9PLAN|nr:glycosyltransferase family protein [Stratiformator vulcanicus]QDT39363.1 hypothetical protein Pan189_37690 [Stratiformator vulcanicus]